GTVGTGLGPAHHQRGYRPAGLHAQFGLDDPPAQAAGGELPLDIAAGMAVTAVQLEPVVGAVAGGVLEREHGEAARAQRRRQGGDDVLEGAEIDERVGRDDQIEGGAGWGTGAAPLRPHETVGGGTWR